LINAGKIIAGGSPAELKRNSIRNPILEIQCTDVIEAMTLIEKEPWALETSVFGTHLHVSVENERQAKELIRSTLESQHISITAIEKIIPSLEDVFIHLLDQEERKVA
jgi:ABC-2 type transport system ATP-binding protein